MTKQLKTIALVFVLLAVGLNSCVDLKQVNDFSSTSLKSIQQFEEIDYSFKQNCLDNCQDRKINDLNLNANDCDCKSNEKADSVTLLIYNSIRGYFDGLAKLSNDDLTNYKLDTLTKALTENDFGSVQIKEDQVKAYSQISKILLKAFTDEYRKKKIKEYVSEADKPIQTLLSFLEFNLSKNLVGKLNVQKERIKSYYFDLTQDPSLSAIDKRTAAEKYYTELRAIEAKQKELETYAKALKKIAEGHQKLVENMDELSKDEIKVLINQYASDVQDIISEFNKLKK